VRVHVYTDGACWGNPGPAAIGVVVKDDSQKILHQLSHYIGEGTNNQAEYRAVIAGLSAALNLKAQDVVLYLDSELIMKQLSGEYKVKNRLLQPLFLQLLQLKKKLGSLHIEHVGHYGNEEAHNLAKQALKNQSKNRK